tara:strand:- start:458 stop:601 length:144 start_codon:yes stop_codon:yes gene_type:complete
MIKKKKQIGETNTKEERLEQALRENLKRRKLQEKARRSRQNKGTPRA